MLVNCGALGLDPSHLSLSGYLEALSINASGGEAGPTEMSDGLRKFMKAHEVLQ